MCTQFEQTNAHLYHTYSNGNRYGAAKGHIIILYYNIYLSTERTCCGGSLVVGISLPLKSLLFQKYQAICENKIIFIIDD